MRATTSLKMKGTSPSLSKTVLYRHQTCLNSFSRKVQTEVCTLLKTSTTTQSIWIILRLSRIQELSKLKRRVWPRKIIFSRKSLWKTRLRICGSVRWDLKCKRQAILGRLFSKRCKAPTVSSKKVPQDNETKATRRHHIGMPRKTLQAVASRKLKLKKALTEQSTRSSAIRWARWLGSKTRCWTSTRYKPRSAKVTIQILWWRRTSNHTTTCKITDSVQKCLLTRTLYSRMRCTAATTGSNNQPLGSSSWWTNNNSSSRLSTTSWSKPKARLRKAAISAISFWCR